jgi:hypothetical protein
VARGLRSSVRRPKRTSWPEEANHRPTGAIGCIESARIGCFAPMDDACRDAAKPKSFSSNAFAEWVTAHMFGRGTRLSENGHYHRDASVAGDGRRPARTRSRLY